MQDLNNLKHYFRNAFLSIVFIAYSSANAQSYEQFFKAIEFDDARTVEHLLNLGVDPNTPSADLQPALTLALMKKSVKAAEILISHRSIRINQVNPHDETPLMMAALKGENRMVEYLIAKGADVNRPGWTPLHYAASAGQTETARLLLDQHAFIDAASPNGTTPLMMAAFYGNPKVTRLLLEQGADPGLRNQLGLTALDFARNGPHRESVELLEAAVKEPQPSH